MDLKNEINNILYTNFEAIMENYNQTALLLHACEKTATYFHTKTLKLGLDTTANIPQDFKLKTDISTIFNKKELINQYEKKLAIKLAKDYLITTVATLDSLMEDIYEEILKEQEPQKTDEQIKKMLRWGENNLPSDLINRIPNLSTHTNLKGFKLEEFLWTYEHLRQIRHATIHTKRKLGQRHLNKMHTLEEKMSEKQMNSVKQLYNIDKVVLSPLTTFILRHWCLTFISYLIGAIDDSFNSHDSSL